MAALEMIATLIVLADDSSAPKFPNSRTIFIACAILAYQ